MQKHIRTTLMLVAVATAMHPLEDVMAQAGDRAAAVLAEARAALGGDEALRGVKTLQATGDIRRTMGEMQMEGESELLLELPDKLRRNEAIGVPGGATMVRTEVLNGDEVWDDSSQRGGMGGGHMIMMRGPGGERMDDAAMTEMRRRMRRQDLARYRLAWLLAADAPLTHAGVAEAPDGKADVLELKPEAGPSLRLFVDQQTHLPLMLAWQGPQPRMMVRRGPGPPPSHEQLQREAAAEPPQTATFELRFDDYKRVNGVLLPHVITRAMNGQAIEEWTIKRYTLNAALKGNTFTK